MFTLHLGTLPVGERRGQQKMRCLDSITESMDMNLSKLWEIADDRVACFSPWGGKESDMT